VRRDGPARRNTFPLAPPRSPVHQLRLALLAAAIGLAVVLIATAIVFWPRPESCGSGSGSASNGVPEYGGGTSENATLVSEVFPAGAHVSFSWSTPDGSTATFRVVSPARLTVYSATGASGSGSFSVAGSSGTSQYYGMGIGLEPPNETVDFDYGCTAYT
jgi:hypothetical protein